MDDGLHLNAEEVELMTRPFRKRHRRQREAWELRRDLREAVRRTPPPWITAWRQIKAKVLG